MELLQISSAFYRLFHVHRHPCNLQLPVLTLKPTYLAYPVISQNNLMEVFTCAFLSGLFQQFRLALLGTGIVQSWRLRSPQRPGQQGKSASSKRCHATSVLYPLLLSARVSVGSYVNSNIGEGPLARQANLVCQVDTPDSALSASSALPYRVPIASTTELALTYSRCLQWACATVGWTSIRKRLVHEKWLGLFQQLLACKWRRVTRLSIPLGRHQAAEPESRRVEAHATQSRLQLRTCTVAFSRLSLTVSTMTVGLLFFHNDPTSTPPPFSVAFQVGGLGASPARRKPPHPAIHCWSWRGRPRLTPVFLQGASSRFPCEYRLLKMGRCFSITNGRHDGFPSAARRALVDDDSIETSRCQARAGRL